MAMTAVGRTSYRRSQLTERDKRLCVELKPSRLIAQDKL